MKYPVGLSLNSKRPLTEEGFMNLKESGIEKVEISHSDYSAFDFEKVKKNAEKAEVQIWSVHLPFVPFEKIDISSLDRNVREGTICLLRRIIERAGSAGIDKFIIHPSGEPIDDGEREERMKCSMESLDFLAEKAHEVGGVIAVEDLPRTCLGRNSEEINRLVSANDKLRVCFDTNHLLTENISDFIRNVGDKIITTHVSDYDFINERHWLPGEGDVNWQELVNTLEEINYNGVWLYEVTFEKGRYGRRDLICKDFYNNAQSIFRGEKPEIISEK